MLTADEKVNELTNLLEEQQLENESLREQLELSSRQPTQAKSPDYDHLVSQLELNREEKQAYYMISSDIQGLISSAMQDIFQ